MSPNPIVNENAQTFGITPESTWNVADHYATLGDYNPQTFLPNIEGFPTDISVNVGQTVSFKIDNNVNAPYRLDIYRLGYYQGNGARLIDTILSTQTSVVDQPPPVLDPATGLVDAGNWSVTAQWPVPTNAVSGIYLANIVNETPTYNPNLPPGPHSQNQMVFIVRNDGRVADFLFQTSDTNWQAYNQWTGLNLPNSSIPFLSSLYHQNWEPAYGGSPMNTPDSRAYKVSYNRPFKAVYASASAAPNDPSHPEYNDLKGDGVGNWVTFAEYPMVRWMESNGYDVTYWAGVDTDRRGSDLYTPIIVNGQPQLPNKVFLSVGHDEYWSGNQRANVEAARDAGVSLAFFSGNEVFWKTRYESNYRTLVCYKETHANAKIDPTATWTGTWMDPRFGPHDGGRPQNALTGTLFTVNADNSLIAAGVYGTSMSVPYAYSQLRFWRNTRVANLSPGGTETLGVQVLGYEWNEDVPNSVRPAGLIQLSSTGPLTVNHKLVDFGNNYALGDYGNTYAQSTATHRLTLYRAASGALVFGAGTIQWSWGLDGNHSKLSTTPDLAMQQATYNLFADMGAQPYTAWAQQNGLLVPNFTSTVRGKTATFALDPATNKLWVYRDSDGYWRYTGGQCYSFSVGTDGNGNDLVTVAAPGIWQYNPTTRVWTELFAAADIVVQGKNTQAVNEIFAVTSIGQLWAKVGAGLWNPIGAGTLSVASVSLGADGNGYDVLGIRATNDRIWQYLQASASLVDTPASGATVIQGANTHGTNEIFVVTSSGQLWAKIANGAWNQVGASALTVASASLGTDGSGNDVLAIRDLNGRIWRYAPSGATSLVDTGVSGSAVVQGVNTDGHNVTFLITISGAIWIKTDNGSWLDTGGTGTSISVGADTLGRYDLWDISRDVWRFYLGIWKNTYISPDV